MSSEIIPVLEGNTISATTEAEQCSSERCAIQPWDLLDPRTAFNPKIFVNLIGGDYYTKRFLASQKGHKYVKHFNPTIVSIQPILKKMVEPSILLLRGCEFLLQSGSFPFDKFKSITELEISGCRHLTSLPENTISQMTRLQSLNLSYLQIDRLPKDLFINAADSLRSLSLKGCSNLHVLTKPPGLMHKIEYLDLSYLPIETLSGLLLSYRLRSLILRGCSKLLFLPSQVENSEIHFLDVGNCTSLETLRSSIPKRVKVLDFSNTNFSWRHVPESVSHLFFRNAKLMNPDAKIFLKRSIKVCDLSGCQDLDDVNMLKHCCGLEALDLSGTGIESIGFLSRLISLRTLVLRNCTKLNQLPTIEHVETLEVLDLSGCGILGDLPQGLSSQTRLKELNLCGCKSLRRLRDGLFDQMSSLEKLDLVDTDIEHMPSFDNLIRIGTVINRRDASVPESITVPTELSSLTFPGSDDVSSCSEFHLVSTFASDTEFDHFKNKFKELNEYVSFLEKELTRSGIGKEADVKRQFESIRADLEYILCKIDRLEEFQNRDSSENLFHELMKYDYANPDDRSSILKKLFRTVVKLKLLISPLPPPRKRLSLTELRDRHFPKRETETEKYFLTANIKRNMARNYESLTSIQRNCLLYFACIPVPIADWNKTIKASTLIHLWYGEGFLDPLLHANSTSNPVSANQQVSTSNAIERSGQKILRALKRKRFIVSINKVREWCMRKAAHVFVITKAREEHSFDINEHGKLTPQFRISRRACLLKSDIDHPPSSHVFLNYTKSSEQLESFKTVRTLLFINEPVVDINTEWFSCMTNLHVLHLVDLYSHPINIVDLKFLEELKIMKRLRFLNLESFAAIHKLPDSICQLTNLTILNLSYCSNLVELPAGIASLTNLIILDLTQCHLLPELPKGLALLSKLEVLKGFPITYGADGRLSKTACTFRELLKLKSLRKLNLVVNKDSFPGTTDLQVLRNMKELRNLNIKWCPGIHKEQELGDTVQKGGLRQSRWKQLKCWGAHNETEEVDDELLLTNSSLQNLSKLVLCCFPFATAPNWVHPAELQKLTRLYIVGGSLRVLFKDNTNQTTWNVEILHLWYLEHLDYSWRTEAKVREYFPKFTSGTKMTFESILPEPFF